MTEINPEAVAVQPVATRVWLRLEGLALLALAVALYAGTGQPWWLFAALFLVPDLSFAAYVLGRHAGSLAYNLTHATLGPAILAGVGLAIQPEAMPIALIWAAHIGFDRALGYGLKMNGRFDHTHLGLVGKAARLAKRRATP